MAAAARWLTRRQNAAAQGRRARPRSRAPAPAHVAREGAGATGAQTAHVVEHKAYGRGAESQGQAWPQENAKAMQGLKRMAYMGCGALVIIFAAGLACGSRPHTRSWFRAREAAARAAAGVGSHRQCGLAPQSVTQGAGVSVLRVLTIRQPAAPPRAAVAQYRAISSQCADPGGARRRCLRVSIQFCRKGMASAQGAPTARGAGAGAEGRAGPRRTRRGTWRVGPRRGECASRIITHACRRMAVGTGGALARSV